MLKNILLYTGGVFVFLALLLLYGFFVNTGKQSLGSALNAKGIKRVQNVNLVVFRSKNLMQLFADTVLVKEYRVALGSDKQLQNSGPVRYTPVGTYKICSIDTSARYHKFLRLNFPNLDDSEEAYRAGIISQKEFEDLKFQFYYEGCVSPKTVLGGSKGIQGTGRMDDFLRNLPFVYNWTDGSVALSNEEIDELFTVVEKGTKVVIKP